MRPVVLLLLWIAASTFGDESVLPADDLEMVKRLHTRALAAEKTAELIDYKNTCNTGGPEPKDLDYEMVAIPGGTFIMGSDDRRAKKDESPAHEVRISPFWMGKYEITWQQYEPFMITRTARNRLGQPVKVWPGATDADIVSKPTSPYTEMSFGMGIDGYPAISMTQHAASKFCQWLSAMTGHFYRLPTEAEWEYACRAGTTGRFSCPQSKIHEYAVCEPNYNNPILAGYARVGTKKPNPWGLYDMHGNVMEWCLDQYNSLTYQMRPENRLSEDPFVRATRLYPRVARGGSWYDPPEACTSTVRYYSEPTWKQQDPQLPKSIWYHTDALWLGFRIVRPFQVPSPEEMNIYWNSASPEQLVKDGSHE